MRKTKQTGQLLRSQQGTQGWFVRVGLALGCLILVVAGVGLRAQNAKAMGETSKFQWARLVFKQSTNTRPTSIRRLLWLTTKRTSLQPELKVKGIKVSNPKLFQYPLVIISGETSFPAWPKEDIRRMRSYLSAGGTLFIDMTGGEANGPFDKSVRRLAKRLFPQSPLQKLPRKHTLYRSFYLIQRFGGRRLLNPYIEGVTRDDRTPIIYSMNDHSGAWERDSFGHWVYPVVPGGENQREHALRFGINLIMYALCVNYKQDGVHIPFIMRRRQ